jgi:hypothetical protein
MWIPLALATVVLQGGCEKSSELTFRCAQSTRSAGRFYLRDGWFLIDASRLRDSGEAISRGTFDLADWIRAKVPGTVLTSMVEQKLYPEPLYGLNNLDIPESLNRTPYWYRTSFVVPAELAGEALWLSFDGINHRAEVWLNGTRLGTIAGAFKRARFEVTARVQRDRPNVLAVKIFPPPNPGVPHEQDLTTAGINGGVHTADAPAFTATIGWDWIPAIRDRNMGIWQEVYLSSSGPVSIVHPQVKTDLPLPALDRASLFVSAQLTNHMATAQEGTLQGENEGRLFRQPVHLKPGESKIVRFDPSSTPELLLLQPRLWWPLGYGKPELYHLKLTFSSKGKISDEQTVRFGIRELSYVTGSEGPEQARFAPKLGRYVRVMGLKRRCMIKYFGIKELEVYSPDHGPTNLALRKNVTTKANTFSQLATLPPVTLTSKATEKTVGDERVIHVSLENPTSTVAVQVRLKLLRAKDAKRVLPVHYDDNYFWLLPKEKKTVAVYYKDTKLGKEQPRLVAEGLNVPRSDIPLDPS